MVAIGTNHYKDIVFKSFNTNTEIVVVLNWEIYKLKKIVIANEI